MKQFRIGIVGGENSHANEFSFAINMPDENGNYRYPDCRVTCIGGHYREANEAVAREFKIDNVFDNFEEMVPVVDAVIITARDGKYHYEFAKPFIDAGIPAFIDKPFTVDSDEARSLIALAKEKRVPLCGGSVLKFTNGILKLSKLVKETDEEIMGGALSAPVALNSEYSGFFFYASHLVEMTLATFGYNPKSISAKRHDKTVCATINYDNFSVTNHFKEGCGSYTAEVYTSKDTYFEKLDFAGAGEREWDVFVDMLRTGKMYNTYEELAIPVYYMEAIKRAYESGETVTIEF